MSAFRRPIERVAILSFHSHGDRSFLDDRDLAIASGDLRDDGIDCDLVLVAFGAGDEEDRAVARRLVAALEPYDVIVYERVWSADLVAELRAALPGRVFIHCRGEHVLADPPADYVCPSDMRQALPALVDHLRGVRRAPPAGALAKRDGAWVAVGAPSLAPPRSRRYAPNLRPIIVNPESFPASRTFSIEGNGGCPYQADARDNPVYAGAVIPAGLGRGCAFCTTGNAYEARPHAAAFVLEQLRYVRARAPELQRLVLKDQNPFAYLTEVVETIAADGHGPFTLMLETRADWFMRSARRFEDALRAARAGGIRISPFLVGIENFSQPELDRYNKGTTAQANIDFIEWLWALRDRHGDTLDLESASFGFVLFSPWTTLDDLEANLRAIQRTRFAELRGHVLLSRARLYPDTALYYLAERDGLFVEAYREGEDASRRYGYYPARPWRFLHDDVAHFAALATKLVEHTGGRDEVALFARLVAAFRAASDPRAITFERMRAELVAAGERRPAPAPAPRPEAPGSARAGLLDIVLGYDCNLACTYCTISDEMRRRALPAERVAREIDRAAARGYRDVAFTGGEPTIRGDLPALVKHARRRGFEHVKVASNGLRYAHAPYLDHLVACGVDRFHVSVHAFSDAAYEATVRRADTAPLRRAAIENLVARGLDPVADLILKNDTYRDARAWIASLHALGVRRFALWLVSLTDENAGKIEQLPRISDVVPHLLPAFDDARRGGYEVVSLHLPRCFLPGYEDHVRHPGADLVTVVTPDEVFDLRASRLGGGVKPSGCEGCRFFDACPGLRADYIAVFGGTEVRAVTPSS